MGNRRQLFSNRFVQAGWIFMKAKEHGSSLSPWDQMRSNSRRCVYTKVGESTVGMDFGLLTLQSEQKAKARSLNSW